MPLRPIDFQNVYLRIEDLSKNISHFSSQKVINEQVKSENINEQINKIKERVTKIERIIDYENRISKLLNDNAFNKGKREKENREREKKSNEEHQKSSIKNRFFNGKFEEKHNIDEKI